MPPSSPRTSATVRTATGTVYALTMSPDQAAHSLLGLGRSAAYEMVRDGTWPTPTTPASATTHRILTLPLLPYAGIPYEFVQRSRTCRRPAAPRPARTPSRCTNPCRRARGSVA